MWLSMPLVFFLCWFNCVDDLSMVCNIGVVWKITMSKKFSCCLLINSCMHTLRCKCGGRRSCCVLHMKVWITWSSFMQNVHILPSSWVKLYSRQQYDYAICKCKVKFKATIPFLPWSGGMHAAMKQRNARAYRRKEHGANKQENLTLA
jgi:hypothetical protein